MDLVMPQKWRAGYRGNHEAVSVCHTRRHGDRRWQLQMVSEAMGYGAYDAVETPTVTNSAAGAAQLLAKLANVDRVIQRLRAARKQAAPAKQAFNSISASSSSLFTDSDSRHWRVHGGPAALEVILSSLKPSFPRSHFDCAAYR